MSKKHIQFVEKYKNCTVEELKNKFYNGQGQVEEGNQLWGNYMKVCRERVLQDLEKDVNQVKDLKELQISKEKYAIL